MYHSIEWRWGEGGGGREETKQTNKQTKTKQKPMLVDRLEQRRRNRKRSTIFLSWKDAKGLSSVRRTLEPFQTNVWGNFRETGWSAYGLFRAHRYLERNGTDLLVIWNTDMFETRAWARFSRRWTWNLIEHNHSAEGRRRRWRWRGWGTIRELLVAEKCDRLSVSLFSCWWSQSDSPCAHISRDDLLISCPPLNRSLRTQ